MGHNSQNDAPGFDRGRLLKGYSKKILDSIEIEEYPWPQLSENGHMLTDNPRRNIFFVDSHSCEEVGNKVRSAPQFLRPLSPKNTTAIPVDLTAEFVKSQEEIKARKRRRLMDEDEAVALELAELSSMANAAALRWTQKEGVGGGEVKNSVKGEKKATESTSSSGEASSVQASPVEASSVEPSPVDSSPVEMKRESGDDLAMAPSASQLSEAELNEIKDAAWNESYEKGYEAGHQEGHAIGLEDGNRRGYEENSKRGFADGFANGEEQGRLEAESKAEKFFALLHNALGEVDRLRNEILASGQDVFIEVAKLASEKIMRLELSVGDESLKRFFHMAIAPYVEREYLAVEMAPGDARRIRGMLDSSSDLAKKIKIKENANLLDGDFKIQADQEVVIVDLRRSVDAALESLKHEIFGDAPQVRKDEKSA